MSNEPATDTSPESPQPQGLSSPESHSHNLLPAHNVVILSPQFPDWVTKFVLALAKHHDVNVLGIGDEMYGALPEELRDALTEYFWVDDMNEYHNIENAVKHFQYKWGKIDRFESLNEHWLETEARIREEFDIPGPRSDFIEDVRRKSVMKDYFKKAGVATIKGILAHTLDDALAFVKDVGYPVIVKPDSGSGASSTYRAEDEPALRAIFANRPLGAPPVVVEEFIDGILLTYDGLVDADGQIVFDNSTRTELSIMDVVNTGGNANYIDLPDVPAEVRKVGRAIVEAYDLRERFFHIEIFERRKGGGLVGLEINLRPPGGWMTDAMNVSHSDDVYAIWAALLTGTEPPLPGPNRYYSVYASRKNFNKYAHSHNEVMDYLGENLVIYKPVEKILQAAMGDTAYLARARSYDQAMDIVDYVQKRA